MCAPQFRNQRVSVFIEQDHADYGVRAGPGARLMADAIPHFVLPSRRRQVACWHGWQLS